MAAVFQKFSEEQKALINPEDTTVRIPGFPEWCVTTFSENIIIPVQSGSPCMRCRA